MDQNHQEILETGSKSRLDDMREPSDEGEDVEEPQAKRRRDEGGSLAGTQPTLRQVVPQQEMGAAVTIRTVRTAASNH